MSGRGEVVLTGAVVTAALAVALANVVPLVTREKPVEKVDGWERALEVGHSVAGPRNAPVKLVVLSDLECPVCRAFHGTATELVEVRDDVELVYVPFPLSYHEHAIPAANAAECAQEVTRLSEWIDVTYASQDSLGHLGWGTLAEELLFAIRSRSPSVPTQDPLPHKSPRVWSWPRI